MEFAILKSSHSTRPVHRESMPLLSGNNKADGSCSSPMKQVHSELFSQKIQGMLARNVSNPLLRYLHNFNIITCQHDRLVFPVTDFCHAIITSEMSPCAYVCRTSTSFTLNAIFNCFIISHMARKNRMSPFCPFIKL